MIGNRATFWTALALTALISTSAAAVALVYPQVSLSSFDPVTFTYTYTVTIPADSSFPFGMFRVYAEVPHAGLTSPWTLNGPIVDGVDQNWAKIVSRWDFSGDGKDYACWQASIPQEIPSHTAWVGQFILTVPNSSPVEGWLKTADGPGSQNYTYDLVPGPIPEPSTIVGLLGGLATIGCAWRARRKGELH